MKKESRFKIADEEFRDIMKVIKGHKITFSALARERSKIKKSLVRDFSIVDCTITLTRNEMKLIAELLMKIPVSPASLGYECAKSIMKKLGDSVERKSNR